MNNLTKRQFDVLYKQLRQGGELSASQVVEMARDDCSALHNLFEWDDEKAATNYRLNQARSVIKKMNVFFDKPADRIVHVPSVHKMEGSYKTIGDVIDNIDEFHLALDELLKLVKPIKKAIDDLEQAAINEAPETTALLAMAMKGFDTVENALSKLH